MFRLLLLVVLTGSAASAQESFAPKCEEGDFTIETISASLHLHLKITDIEEGVDGASREQETVVEREERRETKVLEVVKGIPAAWTTAWPVSKVKEGAEKRATELEGRSVEIRGSDATPADASDAVKSAAREPVAWKLLLPSGPKSPGDSWRIPGAALARIVVRGAREEPSDSGDIGVKFAGIEEKDGARFATLEIDGTLAVDSRQDFKVAYALKGALRWDLAAGHPVSLELHGEAKAFEGRVKDDKGEVVGKIEGKGSGFEVRVDYATK